MSDAILVLNAGSSSVKFSLFLLRGKELELWLHGQTERLSTTPVFTAKDAEGKTVSERRWESAESLGHEGAQARDLTGRLDVVADQLAGERARTALCLLYTSPSPRD